MPEEGETAALVPTGNRPFGQEEKFALAISSEIRVQGKKAFLFCPCQILLGFVRCGCVEGAAASSLAAKRRSIDLRFVLTVL